MRALVRKRASLASSAAALARTISSSLAARVSFSLERYSSSSACQSSLSESDFSSAARAVRALSDALCDLGCVDELYGESVLRRERVSPTSLDFIAVPHGDPERVARTRLAVGRAPQGIEWAGSTVYLVCMLAFSSEGFAASPRFFSSFYRRLARPETERGLRGVADLSDAECRKGMVRVVLGDEGR